MGIFNCSERVSCTYTAIVSSIIIGIITAFLRITGVITVTPVFLWVTFGIAVVYLAVTLIAAALTQRNTTFSCTALPSVLIGILGTILFSIILLAITFATTSIIGAIITGALLAFFTLMITATACLIKCLFAYQN